MINDQGMKTSKGEENQGNKGQHQGRTPRDNAKGQRQGITGEGKIQKKIKGCRGGKKGGTPKER